jgi:hypothetical protein
MRLLQCSKPEAFEDDGSADEAGRKTQGMAHWRSIIPLARQIRPPVDPVSFDSPHFVFCLFILLLSGHFEGSGTIQREPFVPYGH